MTGGFAEAATSEKLVERGVAARDSGDRVGALALFREAVEQDPGNAGPHWEAALTFLSLGLASLAGEALERSLALQPDLPRADVLRGRIAAQRGDGELALKYFMRAIADTPQAPRPYALAAQQLHALGRYREALAIASQGLERCGGPQPGNLDLLEERAVSLAGLGLIEEARELIRSVLPLRKDSNLLRRVALVLTSRKQFVEALDLVEGLEMDARRHITDILSYRRCIEMIHAGRRIYEGSRSEEAQSPVAEPLETSPYVFPHETLLDEIPSLAAVLSPTKCYILDDSGANCPTHELTPSLQSLLEEDLARLRWKPGRRARQICFQYLLPDSIVQKHDALDPRHAVVSPAGRSAPELLIDQGRPLMVTGPSLWDPSEELEPIDCAFVTPSMGWGNYGHVVVDVLSTLAIYERLGLGCPIIVPGRVRNVYAELIRASGVPDGTPVLPISEVRGRLLRLAVCPEPVSAQLLRAWCSTVVRRTVGDSEDEGGDEILYISRAKSVLVRPAP